MVTLLIRTPLGGFINHSEKPNCKKLDLEDEWHLKTMKEIKARRRAYIKIYFVQP